MKIAFKTILLIQTNECILKDKNNIKRKLNMIRNNSIGMLIIIHR